MNKEEDFCFFEKWIPFIPEPACQLRWKAKHDEAWEIIGVWDREKMWWKESCCDKSRCMLWKIYKMLITPKLGMDYAPSKEVKRNDV